MRRLVPVILVAFLWIAVASATGLVLQTGLSLNLGSGNQIRSASGVVDWTEQVPASAWYGAPMPTIECVGAGGGDLTCTGPGLTGSVESDGSGWSGAEPVGLVVPHLTTEFGVVYGSYSQVAITGYIDPGTVVSFGTHACTAATVAKTEVVCQTFTADPAYSYIFRAIQPIKHGTPTTVPAYGYPVAQNAVKLNGITDYYDLGNVGAATGNFTVELNVCNLVTTNTSWLFGRDNGTTRNWLVVASATNLDFYVFKADGTHSVVSNGALPGCHTFAASYTYVADGSSIMDSNVDGTASAHVTNAKGPLADPGAGVPLVIGADAGGTTNFIGTVSRAVFTLGDTATPAQLAQRVASQQARLTKKPAGGAITFTSDGGLCCPVSDAQCYWLPANVPCVTSTGTFVGGASANLFPYSGLVCGQTFTCEGATTMVASALCPAAPDGTQMKLVTPDTLNHGIYASASGITRSMWFARPTADADCDINFNEYNGADGYLTNLTGTPTRVWKSTAGKQGMWVYITVSTTCTRFCAWGPQVESSPTPTLYHATAGAAYAGNATVATVPQVAGALYYSRNSAAWEAISGDPITLTNGTSLFKQCASTKCKTTGTTR